MRAAAGANFTAHDRSITTTVSDGTLNLEFIAVAANAMVGAIEVVQTAAPSGVPIVPSCTASDRGDGLRATQQGGGINAS